MNAPVPLPTMLVVDDEEGPRTALRMVFKSQFCVHAFDNSAAAIEFVHDHAVHVAVPRKTWRAAVSRKKTRACKNCNAQTAN